MSPEDHMPLEPELLELERELSELAPLEMDFPTGQRVMSALTQEIETYTGTLSQEETAQAHAASGFRVLSGEGVTANRVRLPMVRWGVAAAAVAVTGAVVWHQRDLGFGRQVLMQLSGHQLAPASVEVASLEGQSAPRRARIDPVYPSREQNDRPFFTEHAGGSYDIQGREEFPTLNRPTRIPEATSPYGFLDVRQSFALPPDYCKAKGIPGGVVLSELGPHGPGAAGGLEAGDIVLSVDGRPVRTQEEFCKTIRDTPPGSEVKMRIRRGGMEGELKIRLGSAPSA